MSLVTTTGDLTGLVLLGAAVAMTAARAFARAPAAKPGGLPQPRQPVPGPVVPAPTAWQSRSQGPPASVEDRIPGPDLLHLE